MVRSIGNTEGTEGIFVAALLEINFAYLYQGRKLFAKHFTAISPESRSLLISVHTCLDSPVFVMDYVPESVFEAILTLVLEERFQRLKVSPNMRSRRKRCLN